MKLLTKNDPELKVINQNMFGIGIWFVLALFFGLIVKSKSIGGFFIIPLFLHFGAFGIWAGVHNIVFFRGAGFYKVSPNNPLRFGILFIGGVTLCFGLWLVIRFFQVM